MRFSARAAVLRRHTSVILCSMLLLSCGGGSDGNEKKATDSEESPGNTVIPPASTMTLLTGSIGGAGNVDGMGIHARLNQPSGLTSDDQGNVYVADTGNHTIRKISPTGNVTTLAGHPGECGNTDGPIYTATFCSPHAIVMDKNESLYILDGSSRVRKITKDGKVSTFVAEQTDENQTGLTRRSNKIKNAQAMAIDYSGNLYVLGDGLIQKISPSGEVSLIAGDTGIWSMCTASDGPISENMPCPSTGISIDDENNIYFTEGYTVRKIAPNGMVTTVAGQKDQSGMQDGVGNQATFTNPESLTINKSGKILVVDGKSIREITPTGDVKTLTTNPAEIFEINNFAEVFHEKILMPHYPRGIESDNHGNIYFSSGDFIRKILPDHTSTLLAGFSGHQGIVNTASYQYHPFMINPEEITGDEEGNIYFTDRGNHIYTLRKTGRTGEISTISLTEPNAPSGQTALLLPLSSGGLSSDMAGNLYFSSYQTIFRLSRDNTFSSLAGHPTVGRTNSISINPVDGPGSEAIFYRISKLALDKSGNVYIADGNHIRKLDTQNNVTTLPQLSDSGNVIEFGNDIRGLAVDAVGNIYVSDTSNHVIYKMTASGISIVGGSPRESGSDNGNGSVARFKSPQGIAIDGAGNLYVADTGNHTIRKITPDGTVHTIVGKAGVATVAPGPLPALLSAPTDVTITPDGRLVITAPQGLLQVSPIP